MIATVKPSLFRTALVSCALGILATAAIAADPSAADPTGTWQWTSKGHRDQKMQTTLQLQLQDGQLTGTISGPSSDTPISDATFKDNVIAFSVAGGDADATKYSGMLSGETIKGTVTFPGRNGGGPTTRNWTAKRVPPSPPPSS